MTVVPSRRSYGNWTVALIHLGGFSTAALYFGLTYLSQQENTLPLSCFLGILGTAWAIFLLLFFLSRSGESRVKLWIIILWAVIFRLIGIAADPIYENDFHRFLLDGWVFANTGNPYDLAPQEFFSNPDTPSFIQETLDHVNYPQVPTIYGPILECLFLLSYIAVPGNLLALKFCFIAADIALIALFAIYFNRRQLLFYAWCPLVIFEIAFNAHPDVVGALFLFAGYIAFVRSRGILSLVTCGLAVASKPFALLAAPFFAWRAGLRGLAAFILTLFILYVPFLAQNSTAEWSGLRVFLQYWEFNAALYAVFKTFFSPGTAKMIGLFLFTLIFYWLFLKWKKNDSGELHFDVLIGFFFLISPVINPWYLTWLLPFIAIRPRIWSVTALIVVSLSYVTGLNLGDSSLGDFNHPVWLRPLEFGAIAVAIIFDIMLVANRKIKTNR